jgi:hypothetical protein
MEELLLRQRWAIFANVIESMIFVGVVFGGAATALELSLTGDTQRSGSALTVGLVTGAIYGASRSPKP